MSALATRRWYDLFANFYDSALDRTYREHRAEAVRALRIEPGMTVVDVGCGTGASLPHLVAAVGTRGRVIGADASPGMLEKARSRVRRHGWTNVELFRVHCTGDEGRIAALFPVDRVQFFLSLSVIQPWQSALALWRRALGPAGRLVIADVHNPRPGAYARLVELIARADLTRAPWQPLTDAPGFALHWHPSSWVLGGRFFTAAADKDGNRLAAERS